MDGTKHRSIPRTLKTDAYIHNYNGTSEAETYHTHYVEPDADGNIIEVLNYGNIAEPLDDVRIIMEYLSTTGYVFVPAAVREYRYTLAGNQELSSEVRYYYDGYNDTHGVPGTQGKLTKLEQTISPGQSIATLYEYDNWGNIIRVKDPGACAGEYAGYTGGVTYDDVYKTYVTEEKNVLDMTGSYQYDSLMRLTGAIDSNNITRSIQLDEFGRVLKTISPGDTESFPTTQTVYANAVLNASGSISTPASIVSGKKESGNNYITCYTYFDGFGRKIQTRQESANNAWTTIDYYYNTDGRLRKTSVPYETASPAYTARDENQVCVTNEYDGIGRVVRSYNTDGTYSRIVYEKKRVAFIDESGHITTREIDGRAVLESSYDAICNGTVPDSAAAYYQVRTRATWDGVVIEDSMTGSAKTVISTVTDMIGRKLSYTDTDMGTWTYEYDVNGNLTSQTDAKSQTINFDYDRLNRVRHKYHGTSLNSTYLYDGKNEAGEPDGLDHGYCTGMLTQVVYPEG